jgi:hypothetical protein
MTRLLLASLLAGLSFGAMAQSVGTTTEPVVQDEMQSEVPTRDVRDHNCLRETGSLIATAQNQRTLRNARRTDPKGRVEVKCADFGNAYTQQDLRSTGAIDLSQALRQLDPSIH